jgi:leucyl-tRNA synthetase
MYILSDCPLNRDIDWDESGVSRKFDFLNRVNGLYASYAPYAPKGVIELTQGDVKDAWSVDLLTSLQEAADKTDHDIEKTPQSSQCCYKRS